MYSDRSSAATIVPVSENKDSGIFDGLPD